MLITTTTTAWQESARDAGKRVYTNQTVAFTANFKYISCLQARRLEDRDT